MTKDIPGVSVEHGTENPPRLFDTLRNTPWYKWISVLLRFLYNWVLSWANSPYGWLALFLIAFAESSFFPIPPDVLLIALALGWKKKSFHFALLCTVGSVLGAMFGYFVGSAFFGPVNTVMAFLLGGDSWYGVAGPLAEIVVYDGYPFYGYPDGGVGQSIFLSVKAQYDNNAFMAIFTAAFTPIPFKVFTIAGGYFRISFWTLVLSSLLGRSFRFFLVAGLLFIFGAPMRRFIEKYFDLLAFLFMALLIAGFVVIGKLL